MIKEKLFLGFMIFLSLGLTFISHWRVIEIKDNIFNISFFENRSNFLNDSLVNKLLIQKMTDKENQSNLKLDLKELEDYLNLLPEVSNSEVFIEANGTINAKIFESSALLRIQNNGYYIDSLGVKIPFSKNYTPKVPVYNGILKDENIDDLILLTNFITNDDYLKAEFVEIWEDKNGFTIRLRNFDFDVYFGDSKNSKKKIKKLKAFCAYALKNKFDNKTKRIDLTIYDQVISSY